MKRLVFLLSMMLILPLAAVAQKSVRFPNLPDEVRPETKVSGKKGVLTAEQRLRELGARYRKGVLVDSKGRQIRFYWPICRGAAMNAEDAEAERVAKEKELADLKKKNTVITVACDRFISFVFRDPGKIM